MGRRELRAVLAGSAVVAAGAVPGFLTASLAPLIGDDFDFGPSALGLAVAVFYLVCALASTPAGHLAQRIGADRAVACTVAAVVLSCLGIAAAADSAVLLAALLVIGGVGDALAGPSASLTLRREVGEARHGVAFGALQAGAPLSALLAGLALPTIAVPIDWRWAFVAAAAFALLAGLGMPRAATDPRRPAADGDAPRGAAEVGPERVRAVRMLAVVATLASAAGVGLVAFVVVDSVEHGIDEAAAGLLLASISLLSGATRVVVGAAADRRSRRRWPLAAIMLGLGSLGYALLAIGSAPLIVAGGLVAALGWSWPGVVTLAATQRAPQAAGWAVGVVMAGLFAGALAGPLAVGILFDVGLPAVAWLGCGLLSVAAAALLVHEERRWSARASGAS